MPINRGRGRRASEVTPEPTVEEYTVNTETVEPTFDAPEAADQDLAFDQDVDVDAPAVADAEDSVATTQPVEPAKTETKAPARPPVPEGKVSPVAFAKLLSAHLTAKARETDSEAAEITVAPQVVYSYIKNNGPTSKNPFPSEPAEGRAAVVDAEKAIAWWEAKDARVKASKVAAKEKADKKAAKATETTPEAVAEGQPELVEAE